MLELVEQVNTERMSAYYRLRPESTVIVKMRKSQEIGTIL